MVKNQGSKEGISGKWILAESNISPFSHPSYCDSLALGSVFEFRADSTLLVYNTSESVNCNGEQLYFFNSKSIEILEYDMIIKYEILKKLPDTIWLRTRVPLEWFSKFKRDDFTYQDHLIMEEMRKTQVLITLVKDKP
ncbi:MAG: hypothetical protein AAF193_00870 [Bacteroidota bacterium]